MRDYNLTGGGIFAIHFECVSSERGYKKGCYSVAEKAGELISSQPPEGFYLPYGDYRVYRHQPHCPRYVARLGIEG